MSLLVLFISAIALIQQFIKAKKEKLFLNLACEYKYKHFKLNKQIPGVY